jgi:hypothetical protein
MLMTCDPTNLQAMLANQFSVRYCHAMRIQLALVLAVQRERLKKLGANTTSTGLRDRPSTSEIPISNTHLKTSPLTAHPPGPPRSLLPSPRKLHLLQRRRDLEALPRPPTAFFLTRQHQQPRSHKPFRRRFDPLSRISRR